MMDTRCVDAIADAVLYEGYLLYPYRRSALKNRDRWNFGVLYPDAYCRGQTGSDTSRMQTQVLVRGRTDATVEVEVRCLQAVTAERSVTGDAAVDEGDRVEREEREDDPREGGWLEGVRRTLTAPPVSLGRLASAEARLAFDLPGGREAGPAEPARWAVGEVVPETLTRRRDAVDAELRIAAHGLDRDVWRVTAVVRNATSVPRGRNVTREQALRRSMLSAHTIVGVAGGELVSLLEPPAELVAAAADCRNEHTWPVLVGDRTRRDMMLSSPIILYDYPQIAPESAGSFFDGTEIDEMLALRVLTMTDDEKREIRGGDARAREIVERTESLSTDELARLHGTLRRLRPGRRSTEDGS